MVSRSLSCLCALLVIFLLSWTDSVSATEDAKDPRDVLNGLCGKRCCTDGPTNCSIPFVDTVCYCDVTCLDRSPPDCCDDIFSSCRSELLKSPTSRNGKGRKRGPIELRNNCFHNGVRYDPGSKITVNCNHCTCVYARLRSEYNWKCTQKQCLMSSVLIEYINEGAYGWRAQNQTVFWGITLKDGLQRKTGTFPPKPEVAAMSPQHVPMKNPIPDHFDAREKWPGMIHGVMDQGDCASSWAFSTASIASDRLSISSHGKIKRALSPQHLLSCNSKRQDGCEGGNLDRAWWFMRKYGLVDVDCYPYHSGHTGRKGHCFVPRKRRSWYHITCPLHHDDRWSTYKTSPPYRIDRDEKEIMEEIETHGPVQALVEVHEDFFVYKTGIYRHAVRDRVKRSLPRQYNFHSVKMVGWGVHNDTNGPVKYWLCANSWGRDWGEDGYFRILRGDDECQIESFVLGVWGRTRRRRKSPHGHRRGRPRRRGHRNRHGRNLTRSDIDFYWGKKKIGLQL